MLQSRFHLRCLLLVNGSKAHYVPGLTHYGQMYK